MHDVAGAKKYLLAAREIAEDLEEVYLRLSNLYLEEENFQDLVDQVPSTVDSVLTQWNLAKALQGLERDQESLELYQKLMGDLKDNPEFLQEYVYQLRQMGYREDAAEVAQLYLNLVPDDPDMQEFLDGLND